MQCDSCFFKHNKNHEHPVCAVCNVSLLPCKSVKEAVLFGQGFFYFQSPTSNCYEKSVQFFESAILENPNNFLSQKYLGWSLFKVASHQKAAIALLTSIDILEDEGIVDNDARSRTYLGVIFLLADNPFAALPHLKKALLLKPDNTINIERLQLAIDSIAQIPKPRFMIGRESSLFCW